MLSRREGGALLCLRARVPLPGERLQRHALQLVGDPPVHHQAAARRERDGGMEPLLLAMATGYDYRRYQKVKAITREARAAK